MDKSELKAKKVGSQEVILDRDLAESYDVPAKRLNEQVQRNLPRFPSDFMFRLTKEESPDFGLKTPSFLVDNFVK